MQQGARAPQNCCKRCQCVPNEEFCFGRLRDCSQALLGPIFWSGRSFSAKLTFSAAPGQSKCFGRCRSWEEFEVALLWPWPSSDPACKGPPFLWRGAFRVLLFPPRLTAGRGVIFSRAAFERNFSVFLFPSTTRPAHSPTSVGSLWTRRSIGVEMTQVDSTKVENGSHISDF